MTRIKHVHPADLRGAARLATDATTGLADLVEAMHHTIARPLIGVGTGDGAGGHERTRGITGLVYKTVRGITRLVGGSVDAILSLLQPTLAEHGSSPEREAVIAALNGVIGDYLEGNGNPLAIPMTLRRHGQPMRLEREVLSRAFPDPSASKLVVLVHGLCLNDLQWNRNGHDHGDVLATSLGCTPVYLHYNSGRHVSTNGRAFADLLEAIVAQWPHPVGELIVVAHSMGGLVTRSACHAGALAGHDWMRKLRAIVFLGTPHMGAPLERGGNWVDTILGVTPYAKPFARLGKIRSAGITDLRHGSVRDEDWEGRDRFARSRAASHPLPLPAGIDCYAIAATLNAGRGTSGDLKGRLLGDGLVPVDSALGRHDDASRALAFAASKQWVAREMSHMDLLGRNEVSDRIVRWLR